MPRLELRDVCKHVLKDLSLTVEDKEVLVIVGPNGAGKSTVLNVIAGLTDYRGQVYFDGRRMDHMPTHRRGLGYLSLDLAPFPHITVAANIAYGLKVQEYDESVVHKSVAELMKSLHSDRLMERYPQGLSGGGKPTCCNSSGHRTVSKNTPS